MQWCFSQRSGSDSLFRSRFFEEPFERVHIAGKIDHIPYGLEKPGIGEINIAGICPVQFPETFDPAFTLYVQQYIKREKPANTGIGSSLKFPGWFAKAEVNIIFRETGICKF